MLISFDPLITRPEKFESYVQRLVDRLGDVEVTAPRKVEIPVCYDKTFGPDLEFVAHHNGQPARHEVALLVLGPLIGFFGHGYFSVFGVMPFELFPTHARVTAQGLVYNVGRAFSALAPFSVGALAGVYGIGSALAITFAFFLIGAAMIFSLPETRGRELQ